MRQSHSPNERIVVREFQGIRLIRLQRAIMMLGANLRRILKADFTYLYSV